jgi:hypothetical protein
MTHLIPTEELSAQSNLCGEQEAKLTEEFEA